jgi:hypothetical protein
MAHGPAHHTLNTTIPMPNALEVLAMDRGFDLSPIFSGGWTIRVGIPPWPGNCVLVIRKISQVIGSSVGRTNPEGSLEVEQADHRDNPKAQGDDPVRRVVVPTKGGFGYIL